MKKTVIYPGFFDPFTLGHLNIVERGIKVFERVIVAVAKDSPKQSMFTSQERFEMIQKIFQDVENVEVDQFEGLLVTYLETKKVHVLLRGLRTVSDFEYEYQMALSNKTMRNDVETFFMMTEGHYSFLSSTVIKEIARLGGDVSSMLPNVIAQEVQRKYAS